jgi:transposase
MARVEVITGPERRRRWSAERKRAIVAESLAPGAVVTEIARRAEMGLPAVPARQRRGRSTSISGPNPANRREATWRSITRRPDDNG